MDTGLRQLPPLKLATEQILRLAESRSDLVTYPSIMSDIGYITDLQEITIISRKGGYLRLPIGVFQEVMKELDYICEDAERRSRD